MGRDLEAQGTAPGPSNTASACSHLQSPPPARAELEPADSPPCDRVRGHSTTSLSAETTRNRQSSVQLHARDSQTQRTSQRNGSHRTHRQESVLIDDPPPPYPGLSSSMPYAQHSQSQPLHIQQRHSHPHVHHSPTQATRMGHSHVAALHHNTMPIHGHQHQHCSLMHGNTNFHHSVTCTECAHGYHHPEIILPGETQPYIQCDPIPRQPPVSLQAMNT